MCTRSARAARRAPTALSSMATASWRRRPRTMCVPAPRALPAPPLLRCCCLCIAAAHPSGPLLTGRACLAAARDGERRRHRCDAGAGWRLLKRSAVASRSAGGALRQIEEEWEGLSGVRTCVELVSRQEDAAPAPRLRGVSRGVSMSVGLVLIQYFCDGRLHVTAPCSSARSAPRASARRQTPS